MNFLKLHPLSGGIIYINAQVITSFFVGYDCELSQIFDDNEEKIPRTYVFGQGDEQPYKVSESPEEIAAMLCDTKENPAFATVRVTLDSGAYMPAYAHFGADAGADIRTPTAFSVMPHSAVTIDTGVHVEIPAGYVGLIKSKSGLNVNKSILTEGVIDNGYTGTIRVKLYNHGEQTVTFERGDKITQLVVVNLRR